MTATFGQCAVPHCGDEAVVVVRDSGGGELAVCNWHWKDMRSASHGLIRAVRLGGRTTR